jgi:hypothetical protein
LRLDTGFPIANKRRKRFREEIMRDQKPFQRTTAVV